MQTVQAQQGAQRLLGVDWGTSNRRAYLVDRHGGCLASHADGQGMLAARPHFAASLAALLDRMEIPPDVPVLASGMVGSAQGWREIPYLDIAVPLDALPAQLAPAPGLPDGRRCLIVPGYSQRGARVDVMRGEETQLLGALALGKRDGWVVLPGTHSKWVLLEDGVIRRFATFMTGELFATLAARGTLAPLMNGGEDEAAFVAGVEEARARAPLSTALFGVRAQVVTGAMPAAQARSWVSGLLVGAEFVSILDQVGEDQPQLTAIASPALQRAYALAAARLGVPLQHLDPESVYCAALARFLASQSR
ncbi:2-dehydro-3-deoxygalactonokinase [Massilia niastensis]|uniref:2-dehydro-3-deoxygalactonokinase n=1 Tax=Massilia niastensis TaxID=544911 RepID=UPI00035D6BD7|nr:2-dehydro-3-deoxygalactonokinase [Massilia niastensis]